jgi:hypothetical protein
MQHQCHELHVQLTSTCVTGHASQCNYEYITNILNQLKRWSCSFEPAHAKLLSTACCLCCFQPTFVQFFFMSTLIRSPLGCKKKGHSTNNTKKNALLSVTSRSIKMQQDEKCFAQVTTRMEMTGNYFTPAQPLKL